MPSLRNAISLASLLPRSRTASVAGSAAGGVRTPGAVGAAAAWCHSTPAAARDEETSGRSVEGRVEGSFDNTRHEGDTYYATPKYPNTTPDNDTSDASAAALAASRAPHPHGPADTSSMNDAASRGHEHQGTAHSAHVHHPDRPDAIEGMASGSYAGAGAGGDQRLAHDRQQQQKQQQRSTEDTNQQPSGGSSTAAAGTTISVPEHSFDLEGDRSKFDFDRSKSAAEEFDQAEGGPDGGIAGAWRAMTADFAAGGDDMTGGGSAGTVVDDVGMKINAESGLPAMQSVDDAGAHASRFGRRDPQQAKEEGGSETARQARKSSGQVPADVSSG